jgi:hypothetical protein
MCVRWPNVVAGTSTNIAGLDISPDGMASDSTTHPLEPDSDPLKDPAGLSERAGP